MKFLCIFLISSLAFAQQARQLQYVDFKTANASLSFDVPQKKVMGTVAYEFEVLKKKPDTIYIDAKNIRFSNVKINGKTAKWTASANALKLYKGYRRGKNKVEFRYEATPKQTMYFVKDGADDQIWTQGQGKYTSHWLPSFDDVNEKVVFNISVSLYGEYTSYTALSNGILKNIEDSVSDFRVGKHFYYKMDKPMSSYLVMVAIGKFRKWKMDSAGNTPLEFYLRHQDSAKWAPTYRYSYEMFNFLEEEIGVQYPWGIYRQVPVLDFLYAGMENTTSTIFSQDFVVDKTGFNDRTYTNVNAHELAHQWFGDLITAQSGRHHWLHEGFATYYALLAEQELFGEDHFYYELYQMAERLQQAAKTDTIPVLNEKASSLSFYQKGAWALHVLREGVGHDAFRTAVKAYLEKYAYKTVTTEDFFAETNKVSGYDTEAFRRRWLEKPGFEIEEALGLLKKNDFMGQYLELGNLQEKPFAEKKELFKNILESKEFYPVKEEVLFQMAEVPFEEKAGLVRIAMESGNLKLRQAVARTVTTIPPQFFEEYRSLMDDDSYITKEIVLNVLCSKFPDRQAHFLDASDTWVGFNDKNLRILWLALACSAKDYRPAQKEAYYAELQDYASDKYESGVRTNALANLMYLGKPDTVMMKNLVNATTHHKWQFAKFGRESIRKLLKKKGYRLYFQELLPQLTDAEQRKLEAILAES
ncbi:aminopeptidase [Flavobacterium cyanobacteriorum]|uniref:Aminopeptidase N n=1 Tax=Flavobacterium cyanobacteriorum TaxID=2022802 RepID=A0A255ZAQ9_9FLAO|nr:M1 family metallopeptidase [Flavobacterium cyanobacteriorum]OYQ37945.1 aminopeptidase [Flavobacterium cyanobacteriorum]